MKLRVSISVAALSLAVVCFTFLATPQNYLYEWALSQALQDASYTIQWIDGVAHLDDLKFNWPSDDLEKDWKTQFAFYLIEGQPVSISGGALTLEGVEYQIDGLYGPTKCHLTMSLEGSEVITLDKEGDSNLWTFTNAPLFMINAFMPKTEFKGVISKGYIDENKRGNLEIANFSYKQNEFKLDIPKAYLEMNGSEAKVLGVDVSLSYQDKPMWSLNPLPLVIKLEKDLPFSINADSTLEFVDQRFLIGSYVKNLKAEGHLLPARVDLLTFTKSTLRPLNNSSILHENHVASCNYKNGCESYFTLLGKEVCCEINFDKEKTFALEFSNPFLHQFGMHELPLNKMVGKIERENNLWHLSANLKNGKADAYLASLLLPQASMKDAYLSLDEWALKKGPLLKEVSLHFYPEKTVWKANYEGITFHGSGNFTNSLDIQFNGTGNVDNWKKVLANFSPKSPLINCPMSGICTVSDGIISGDTISFNGQIENGALSVLKNVRSKFHYENGTFNLSDLMGNFEYRDKMLSVFAPKVSLGKSIDFDGWISDQSQDFVRLAGNGFFLGNQIMVEFDNSKTHLFNMVPSYFTVALKDWTHVETLVFRGNGPNHSPLFEDLNRWTENHDWDIAMFYEQEGTKNHFEVHKGPLALKGSMKNLAEYQIHSVSLAHAGLSLSGSGLIDLNHQVVQLDPIQIDVNFAKDPTLAMLPLQGSFSAMGVAIASLKGTESWLEVNPQNLSFGILELPNTPFQLHQKGEDLNFHCNYLINQNLFTGFNCLLNKAGLKAKNQNTSFYIGSTHFGIDKAGMTLRGRHSPTFALTEPLKTDLELVKAFLPFSLNELQGGSLYLKDGHCCITETQLLGKEIDQIDFDFETPLNQDLFLKNVAMKNEGESIAIQMATLSFDNGKLHKVSIPSLYASNVSFSPLMIKHISMANFESEMPFKEFKGKGTLAFSNLLPMLSKHLKQDEIAELSSIDAKWFLPNQGEVSFEAKKDQLLISELKECFSSGKMIRFELNPDIKEATVLWDGTISFPLKLKPQHLSFKWSELFSLKLQGSLFEPHLELKKK